MKKEYNLVIIGAGAAGLVSAYLAAVFKAKVVLIEKESMGGDCLNTGCVPSKALIKTASLVHQMRHCEKYGISDAQFTIDFPAVMARVHKIIKEIEPHDSVERYESLGVECLKGNAKILDSHTVEVEGRTLTTQNIILAQGAEPFIPPIQNLDRINYLTSENLWDLKELPKNLIVLGGGPIGCELAQSFSRLGSIVTQVEMADRLLTKEDPEVSESMRSQFFSEGIEVRTGHRAISIDPEGKALLCETSKKKTVSIPFDKILICVGRKARTNSLDLDALNIKKRKDGTIAVDDYMCANGDNIFACGDITGPYQFTHMASHQAFYAATNALFRPFKRFKVDYRVVPWVTFTDPEIARVGLSETEAQEKGIDYEVFRYGIDDLDRAITDSQTKGFVKVLIPKGSKSGKILGALIVGQNAGEMNTEFIAAMRHDFGLKSIMETIHPYPTMSEANKYVAGIWRKSLVNQAITKVAEKFHQYRR